MTGACIWVLVDKPSFLQLLDMAAEVELQTRVRDDFTTLEKANLSKKKWNWDNIQMSQPHNWLAALRTYANQTTSLMAFVYQFHIYLLCLGARLA